MSMKLEIVPLKESYLADVLAIEREVFRERDPWPRTAFESELRNPGAVWRVAVEGGRIAGYGGGWCVVPEFHLLNLAVAADLRRRGVAVALLGEVFREAAARGCSEIFLEMRKDNSEASALYAKLGFVPVSRRPRYYAGGADALVLRRVPVPGGTSPRSRSAGESPPGWCARPGALISRHRRATPVPPSARPYGLSVRASSR